MAKHRPEKTAAPIPASDDIIIKHPALWLIAVIVLLYAPTLSFGLTDLDDGIFINTFRDFNEDITNLFTAFARSAFNTSTDLYYRPIILDTQLLNYQIANHGTNLAMYHAVNILFHVIATLLLYRLFIRLQVRQLHAFILCLIFAVHPVFNTAVSWIPGRIEPLLAIFIFSFFLQSINYAATGKLKHLLGSCLFLLLAFFLKETTVGAIPTMGLFLLINPSLRNKRNIGLFAAWAACFFIWLFARIAAHIPSVSLGDTKEVFGRIPVILQYIGKLFCPIYLSVFPLQVDTPLIVGIVATLVVLTAFYFAIKDRKGNRQLMVFGLSIFFLFLLPALFVPKALSPQVYEYRVYIPAAGLLLALSQTPVLLNRLGDKKLLFSAIGISVIFAIVNLQYQRAFVDPLSFWSQAVASAPHDAGAHMMLAARTPDEATSKQLIEEAFRLNPRQRNVNFIFGVMLQEKDSVLASEKYLLTEKQISGKPECDLYLARVEIAKQHYTKAIAYLETFLHHDPSNEIANNTLVLMYLETDQYDKARARYNLMMQKGYEVKDKTREELHRQKVI